MRHYSTHTKNPRWFAILILIISLLLWLPEVVTLDLRAASSFSAHLGSPLASSLPTYAALLITFMLTCTNALLTSSYINILEISNTRSIYPAAYYMLSVGTFPALHQEIHTQLAVMCIITALRIFHSINRHKEPIEENFQIGLLLSSATFLLPDSISFIPFYWLLIQLFNKLTLRIFLSFTIGAATISILAAGYFHYAQTWPIFANEITRIFATVQFADFNISIRGIYTGLMWLYALICTCAYLSSYHENKANTRKSLNSLGIFVIALLPLMFVKNRLFYEMSALWFFILAVFCSYLFLNKRDTFRSIAFFIHLAIHIACFVLNHWGSYLIPTIQ